MTNGKFARTHDKPVKRWQEHLQSVLNCPEPTVMHDWIGNQPSLQLPVNTDSISEEEVNVAVKQLKNGKAAGVNNIQPELLKSAGSIIPHLTRACNMVWQHEATPVDWKNGITYKERRFD